MKNKYMIPVVPILLIIAVVVVILVSNTAFTTYLPLSIDKYDFVENGEFGQTFRVFTSTITSGERIIADTNVENTDFSATGTTPKKDFEIDIDASNQVEYEINNNYEPIYRYDIIVSDTYFCTSPVLNHAKIFASSYCPSNDCRFAVKKADGTIYCRDLVLLRDKIGTIGDIRDYDVRSISKVCLTPVGSSAQCVTIDNLGSTIGRTSNMKVQYAGDVTSGYGVDSIRSSSNRPLQPVYTGRWHFNEEQTINQYTINEAGMITFFDNVVTTLDDNDDWWNYPYRYIWDTKTEIRTNNLLVQELTVAETIDAGLSGLKSFIFENELSETGTTLRTIPTENKVYSQLVIDIDADWVGIERNSGIPSIVSVKSDSWQSAVGDGHVYANIKNIGSDTGTFQATLSCSGIFTSTNSLTYDLSPSQTKEFDLRFRTTGSCANNPSSSCTVNVQDVISGKSDSANIQVSCTGTQICDSGDEICSPDLNAVQKCNSEGTQYVTTRTCPSGTRCIYTEKGVPYCSGELEPLTCEDECSINYEWYNPQRYWCEFKCSITEFFVANIWFFVGFFFIVILGIALYIYLRIRFGFGK